MAINLDSRLTTTARALARLYSDGQLTLDQLREQMRAAIANAHTVALLSGTGGQESAAIDAALRTIIQGEWAELDRLIALIETRPDVDIEPRLLAFADALEETRADGEQLVSRDNVSVFAEIAAGTALGALLARIVGPDARVIMPRIDNQHMAALYDTFGARLDMLSDDLASGALFPDDWHAAMQRELRLIHGAYARVGGGSLNEERVQRQLEFLQGWRDELDGGKLDANAIRRRARMYLDNAQASLQEAKTQSLGFVLPAYPKDGSTLCLSGCKCRWDIRAVEGGYNCTWKLRPAEHCPNCESRAALWNPIEVRNGKLGPYSTIGTFV